MAAWKLGPALAAGCTRRAQAGRADAADRAAAGRIDRRRPGFPEGVVNIVTGFGETAGAALAAHPDVDKVAFTGSTEVGRLIVQAAAGNLKKVTLELGGKVAQHRVRRRRPRTARSPAPPAPSSSTTASAAAPARGSTCTETIYDEVVEGVADEAAKIKRRAPASTRRPRWGRWCRRSRWTGCAATSSPALREGAKVADRRQPRRRPGLLRRADRAVEHQRQHEDRARGDLRPGRRGDAVHRPRRGRRAGQRHDVRAGGGRLDPRHHQGPSPGRRLRAGTVWINCYNVFDAALPFGGYKQSGWGREMGQAAVELYTEIKAVTTQLF